MEEEEEAEFSYDDEEEDGASDDEPMDFDVALMTMRMKHCKRHSRQGN